MIPSEYNVVMKDDLIRLVDDIIWDPDTTDADKVKALQGYLYQYGANQDHLTDSLFGDDEAHVESPNMRRL